MLGGIFRVRLVDLPGALGGFPGALGGFPGAPGGSAKCAWWDLPSALGGSAKQNWRIIKRSWQTH